MLLTVCVCVYKIIRICHVANDFDKKKCMLGIIQNVFLNIWWVHCAFIKIVFCCRCCQCCCHMFFSSTYRTHKNFQPHRDKIYFVTFSSGNNIFVCYFLRDDELQLKLFEMYSVISQLMKMSCQKQRGADEQAEYGTHHVLCCKLYNNWFFFCWWWWCQGYEH